VSSASSPPPATSSAGAVANYAQYTGGSGKATASLSPVTIGFVDMQGGPPSESDPEAALAAQAAAKMINTVLGGVHGHLVQLSTCFIQDPGAQGTTCGEQFVNNKGVKVIVGGIQPIGNAAMYSVLNGTIRWSSACPRARPTTRPRTSSSYSRRRLTGRCPQRGPGSWVGRRALAAVMRPGGQAASRRWRTRWR
jgi:hypothetical protein